MAELWFIRHFRTPWNSAGRLQGHRDIALEDPLPEADQAALAHNRALIASHEFGAVWCSPLLRARQTAALHGFDAPQIDPDLSELHLGGWEGRLWTELEATHPGAWHDNPRSLGLGESIDAFGARVAAVVARVRDRDGPPVLLFGHGAWAGCLRALAAGDPPDRFGHHRTPNGALLRVPPPAAGGAGQPGLAHGPARA